MNGEIGMAAGRVWKLLSDRGPLTTVRIRNAAKMTSGMVHMALGWLAREDKVVLEARGRDYLVGLR